MLIVLVDNDRAFVDLVSYALARRGHRVVATSTGEEALRYCQTEAPDLVLLAASLPDGSALSVCRAIRCSSGVPVILLGVQARDEEILRGYESGADDCVVEPVSIRQLQVRVDAMLRRSPPGLDATAVPAAPRLSVGDLVLEPAAIAASKNGVPLALSRIEYRLLSCLVQSAGRTVGHRELAAHGWPRSAGITPGSLKAHVSRLRRKLRATGGDPINLQSIWGAGYLLTVPAKSEGDHSPQPYTVPTEAAFEHGRAPDSTEVGQVSDRLLQGACAPSLGSARGRSDADARSHSR